MRYPEPRTHKEPARPDQLFQNAQLKLKEYALKDYFEQKMSEAQAAISNGTAQLCPYAPEICDYEYCQSICQDAGCHYLNLCWNAPAGGTQNASLVQDNAQEPKINEVL